MKQATQLRIDQLAGQAEAAAQIADLVKGEQPESSSEVPAPWSGVGAPWGPSGFLDLMRQSRAASSQRIEHQFVWPRSYSTFDDSSRTDNTQRGGLDGC
jgi:hypothetical protein